MTQTRCVVFVNNCLLGVAITLHLVSVAPTALIEVGFEREGSSSEVQFESNRDRMTIALYTRPIGTFHGETESACGKKLKPGPRSFVGPRTTEGRIDSESLCEWQLLTM